MPDVYEEARNMVDLSIRFPLVKTLDVRVDAKNLLDAEYRVTQSNLLREGYRAGRVFAIGLGWRP